MSVVGYLTEERDAEVGGDTGAVAGRKERKEGKRPGVMSSGRRTERRLESEASLLVNYPSRCRFRRWFDERFFYRLGLGI